MSQLPQFSKVPPRDSQVWKTPMFEQYWRIRESLGEVICFYRMGDFYELFGQDAVTAAPILEVQLTARDKEAEIPVPMCGVPFHAWESYAERLLSKGHKIALCEQLTPPGKSKLVERGVVRILTPGLPVDFKKLDSRAPHYFCSLSQSKNEISICLLDFLAGQYFRGTLSSFDELLDLLKKVDPKELLLPHETLEQFALPEPLSKRVTPWSGKDAEENLKSYLQYTQRAPGQNLEQLLPEPKSLKELLPKGESDFAVLPSNVLEQWDVLPMLFEKLDGSGSVLGSRKLRSLLSTPLRNPERILARQDLIRELEPKKAEFLKLSREVYDLERILGRFRIGAADPKELLRFMSSLEKVFQAMSLFGLGVGSPRSQKIQKFLLGERISFNEKSLEEVFVLLENLKQKLHTDVDPARSQSLAELLKSGFDAELDELKLMAGNSQLWLESFEETLRQKTEIPTLKLRFNRVFGYYIEVTKLHVAKVPSYFERKQTTVNGERFTCVELRNKEAEILQSQSRSEAKAKEILQKLEREILAEAPSLFLVFEVFAYLDAFLGASHQMERLERWGAWSWPDLKEGSFFFEVEGLRHPILEDLLQGAFVPVDLTLKDKRLLLLTGPNMAGKSTLMRELGLGILLAQCGFRVPASRFVWAPCSGFYSRMGATDKILEGDSTFMVEMKETARILNEADTNSFVLVDEIGRGTSTQDGLAIAQAVLEFLLLKSRSLCLFATHYHELSDWSLRFKEVQNASMAIEWHQGALHFLRTLEFRPTQNSYGIHVAKMAGLPRNLIAQAEKYLKELRSHQDLGHVQLGIFQNTQTTAEVEPKAVEENSVALSLLEKVKTLELDALSPRQAWEKLDQLKAEISRHEADS